MSIIRFYCAISFLFITHLVIYASYSVKVGNSVIVKCDATPPEDGWITHAFFELDDPNDKEYVAFNYNSADQYATFYGLAPKSNIKIIVTYAYSFRGKYDNDIHVGHASYNEYISVTGGPKATGINIIPNDVHIKVGETTKLKVELVPANSSTTYNWGVVETISSPPSYYEISKDGDIITVKAKKPMKLYLVAETSNGLYGTCVVTATKEGDGQVVPPTSIVINSKKTKIKIGETIKLDYSLIPENASTSIIWSSSDNTILSVSSDGNVKGVAPGKATVTVTTSNGLSNTITLDVLPEATKIELPSTVNMNLGYSYQLSPIVYPNNAEPTLKWESSDKNIAKVTSGKITAYQEGSVTITATSSNGLTASTKVNIVRPSKDFDYRNVNTRVNALKNLMLRTITTQK